MLLINENYQNAINLSGEVRNNKANQIANITLKVRKLKEGAKIALSKAKEAIADYNAKRINNVKIYTLE